MACSAICIDYREKDLLAFFQPAQAETLFIPSSKIKPDVRNLEVGDIIIGLDSSGIPCQNSLIIERKAVADFEHSFLDGRYRDQRARLLAYCEQYKANVAYIIEGDFSQLRRLSDSAVKKLQTRLVFHYKIPVFFTKNIRETADLVACWLSQWEESRESFGVRNTTIELSDSIVTTKKVDNPRLFMVGCLVNCQGVSVKIAETLVGVYGSWDKLFAASAAEIADVQSGSGRKIGPTVAARLWNLLHTS
jgi:ERCC4-type nuclease